MAPDQHYSDVAGMSRCLHVTELREWTGRALRTVRAAFDAAGLRPSGPGMSLIRPRAEGTLDVTTGYPVGEAAQWSPLIVEVLLGGGAARTLHLGPYDSILAAYDLLIEWLSEHHRKVGSLMWEEYLVGPDDTAAAAGYETRVVCPLSAAPTPLISAAPVPVTAARLR